MSKVLLDMYAVLLEYVLVRMLISVYSASDDLENSDKLRSLLKDLREARQAKCRAGLAQIDYNELSVRLFDLNFPNNIFTSGYSFRIFVPWKLMKSVRSSYSR